MATTEKILYIVRHGESTGNVSGGAASTLDAELTENGKSQAWFLAERFKKIPIDCIISSSLLRARQTAEIISSSINKKIDYSDLIVESRTPSEYNGKPENHPEILRIIELIKDKRQANVDFRYSDEETIPERKKRFKEFFEYITKRPESNFLVVSHAGTIKGMLGYMILGEKLTGKEWYNILRFFRVSNTGITVCRMNPDRTWKLLVANDQAHLGELHNHINRNSVRS